MTETARQADITLERDVFLRTLVRELAGALEETVGLEAASGYISIVAQHVGTWIEGQYRSAWDVDDGDELTADQVAEVLVDLKARIQGTFELVAHEPDRMRFHNGRCPFEEEVEGRESMCMMTSNVFGTIAAENLGYARVELLETIARGDGRCVVDVHLVPPPDGRAVAGREYFDSER